jgi:type IV secretion system protein VirB4
MGFVQHIKNKFDGKIGKVKQVRLVDALQWSYCVKREEVITDEYKEERCVVIHKDGCMQQSFAFRGNDLDSYSGAYINSVSVYLNEAVKRLGDGWMVSLEAQRHLTDYYPESDFEIEAGYLVEQERKKSFQGYGEHFDSCYYMTFVYKPEGDLKRKAARIFFSNVNYAAEQEDQIDKFLKETNRIMNLLEQKLLIRSLNYKETVQYLHSTVSLRRFDMILPEHFLFLDTFISDSELHYGQTMKLGDYYIPIICINDFPMETYPSMLHELNKSYIEYRWVSRYFPMEKAEAKKELDKWQGKHHGARKSTKQLMAEMALNVETHKENIGAGELEADVGEAMKELEMDYVGLGYYNSCVMVWDLDYEKAMQKMMAIIAIIEGCGFTCKEETYNSLNAFLGMTVGDVLRNIRRPLVTSGNYSHVLPLSAVWSGMVKNSFTGEVCGIDAPLLTCSTNYGTPFFLNLNDGDVGHTLIFGPTGAGKSTLLGLLSVSHLKYPLGQVFIIDKGRSALTMTMAVGGEFVDPGLIKQCFQPLRDIDTPAEKAWAVDFIETLCEVQGIQVKPRMLVQIRAVIEIMSNIKDKSKRTLTTFKMNCVNTDEATGENLLDEGVSPYTLKGPYGHIFDGEDTKINESRWVLFEMEELMEYKEKVVAPAIMFIFHWLEKKFKGQMTMLIIDEAWRFLDHEVFRRRMKQWLKELRKKHVFCIFATQEVADGANSEIASTLIQNCPTKIYLADPEAHNNADAYEKFGLTEDEINILALARKKRDYYYKSPAGARLFQLDLGLVTLSLMRQMDNVIKRKDGKLLRWKEFIDALLERRANGDKSSFVEEILDKQGVKFRHYLEDVKIDEITAVA